MSGIRECDVIMNPERVEAMLKKVQEEAMPKLVGEYMGIKIFASPVVPKGELWSVDSARKRVFRMFKEVVEGGG